MNDHTTKKKNLKVLENKKFSLERHNSKLPHETNTKKNIFIIKSKTKKNLTKITKKKEFDDYNAENFSSVCKSSSNLNLNSAYASSKPIVNLELEEKIMKSLNCAKSKTHSNFFVFDLSSVQLYLTQHMQILFEFLKRINKVYGIDLQIPRNFLGDSDLNQIIHNIEKFVELDTLVINLEQNYIGGNGLLNLTKKLELFQYLQKLSMNMSWVGIKEVSLLNLGISLNKLNYLTDLELSFDWNSLPMSLMIDFFCKLSGISQLKYLKLSFIQTEFNDNLCLGLTNFINIQKNLTLLKLNLKWNEIGDEGFISLLQVIFKENGKLRKLEMDFDNNKITDVGLLTLTCMLKNLKYLEDFQLKLYENLLDLSFQVFVEEILRKKSLFSAVFHLGKCIYNEKQIIITKIQYIEVLEKMRKLLNYKRKKRSQLLYIIGAIKTSRLKKYYRKEIINEIIEKF